MIGLASAFGWVQPMKLNGDQRPNAYNPSSSANFPGCGAYFMVREDRDIVVLVTTGKEFLTLVDIMRWVTRTCGVCEISFRHHSVNPKHQVRGDI